MPKWWKVRKDRERRKRERRENYEKGRFGRRKNKFGVMGRMFIIYHIIQDRRLARWLGSSVNGIQTMRWRIKCGKEG